METDNGITPDTVDRELLYARTVSEMLYESNQPWGMRELINFVYSTLWRLGLMKLARSIIRGLGLETSVKKFLTR